MKRLFTHSLFGIVLCFLFVNFALAQNAITVSGKVTDAQGLGLPAVSVSVKGTNKGTQTNAEGSFSLQASVGNTLVFSYLGFQTKEVQVTGSTLNVQLIETSTALEQVVVIGYGVQKKLDVTGAVAQVKGEEISKQSVPNAVSALQGKVAGVQITNSGSAGTSPQIRIRGLGTVYGDANPLYVVDGTWYNDIGFLNPSDIESINILKDASSTAMYGVRASNGVVLITTKRGKGDTRITYNGYVGLQTINNTIKMANASQYATLINELNNTPTFANPDAFGNGTDWMTAVTRNSFTTNQYLTVSGGSEKSSYNFSIGYFGQGGNVEKNQYDRITARLQNDILATKFLKIGYNAILENKKSTDVPDDIIYKAVTAAPVVPVRYADGSWGDPADYPVGNVPSNPALQLDVFTQESKGRRITGSAFAEFYIVKGLTFKTNFGAEYNEIDRRTYNPVYNYDTELGAATHTQYNQISLLTINQDENNNWIWENTLTYEKTLDKHRFTLLGGLSAQRYKNYFIEGSARNVPNSTSGDIYLALGDNDTRTLKDGGDLSTAQSYFGRINYVYNDKYLLNASFRADGSSKFSQDDKWGYFPSVGIGWVISREEFMKKFDFINELKIRGSWGIVGNSGIQTNISTLTVDQKPEFTAVFGGLPYTGANITSIVPPVLVWERGNGTDFAIEGAFMNNRLTAELDWYNRTTERAIFPIPVLTSLGTTSSQLIGNQADIRNRGFEFSLGWKDGNKSNFTYSLNANLSINNNKVTNVESGENPIYAGGDAATGGQLSTITVQGEPIGQFYGLVVDGIFQNDAEVAASAQPDASPGDFKYHDKDGNGIIDARDREVIGNPNPKYMYGINTSFAYKAFDLAVDFQGVAGVDIYNANKGVRFGSENYSEDFYNNRWHGAGTSNSYPSANVGGGQNYVPNSWYVENGSYFRIRNIQLGYTFDTKLISKWKMQKVRVYVNAQNPITFFSYTGFNPEVGTAKNDVGGTPKTINTGIDRGVYPLYATYNFGLNVTF
ncbi:SusC/RagA family TonB-linked outer membrane protein [Solitalea longa]|uniref:SusC/RagA family TonB-linked outer membrane protein n=1 Tax=Solitalea longa TaxID=2079460 RepID=A0A2S5A6F7_9SPHI|nr:TonB-dependent receptor [Solitalea longa]POY37899.1 SusC/RagA family TonB-linked outer membrane protein [Solitalea longa]